MNVVLISLITIAIIILTSRIVISLKLSYDILLNSGKVTVKLFRFLTVLKLKIRFEGLYFRIIISKKRSIKVFLYYSKEDFEFFNLLQQQFFKKINVTDFEYNLSLSSNDYLAVFKYYAITKSIFSMLNTAISAKVDADEFSSNVYAGFNSLNVLFELTGMFMISLFDIVWILFYTIIIRRDIYGQVKKIKR